MQILSSRSLDFLQYVDDWDPNEVEEVDDTVVPDIKEGVLDDELNPEKYSESESVWSFCCFTGFPGRSKMQHILFTVVKILSKTWLSITETCVWVTAGMFGEVGGWNGMLEHSGACVKWLDATLDEGANMGDAIDDVGNAPPLMLVGKALVVSTISVNITTW